MKATQKRINVIAVGLMLVGGAAWINTIASFVITSDLKVTAELILLFAGMGLLSQTGRRARYALLLLIMAGIVVVLIPVTAYTISPTVTVSLFGEEFSPYSYVALGYIILMTGAYLATIVWLYIMLRQDLRYEDSSDS